MSNLLDILTSPIYWLSTLRFDPDAYIRRPEAWLANQAGHLALGVWVAIVLCGVWAFVFGEFPRREGIWVILAVGYMWYELATQSWRRWDTIEDWFFVAVYGAGGALYCFHEVQIGSDRITASLYDILFASIPPVVHLLVGAALRAKKRLTVEGQENVKR